MWNFPRLAADLFSGFDVGDASGSPGPDVFEQTYSCYPVSFAGREELERGNKILLPQSALSTLARMNVTWPMLFSLTNDALNRATHGGVLEFSADEGTCYMPYWMMRNLILTEGDKIKVCNTSLPKGTYVKLQPITSDFLDISDHRAVLEHALCLFAALTTGDNIVIQHNQRNYEIEIVECRPAPAVSIIETDIQVDFAPPKDYVEPTKPDPPVTPQATTAASLSSPSSASGPPRTEDSSLVSSRQENNFKLFGGAGHRLDGNAHASFQPSPLSEKQSSGSGLGTEEESSEQHGETHTRIPGGVRTVCSEYTELIQSGRLPGMIGKARPAASVNTPRKSPGHRDKAFSLFGGEGRTCG